MNEINSLYIHIPFCKQKCNYCDFVSYPGKEALIDDYVEALCKEIKTLTPFPSPSGRGAKNYSQISGEQSGVRAIKTIYFGGGTPTLLETKHFDKIIRTLIGHWSLDIVNSEISVEANPGTADKTKLKELRQLGINRLSIGVQSFNDTHLKTLGRIHNSKTALKFYDDARSAGFENNNLDLIFALPNQTFSEWQSDLNQALHLKPDHLSCYCLEGRMARHKEDLELAMYEYTIETLTASGFEHYEISNFARPGFECRHNITYWKNENYIGIGAGAHSHVKGKRWSNPNCIEKYISFIRVGRALSPTGLRGRSTRNNQETIFMGLRMLKGLPANKFKGFDQNVTELLKTGLLTIEKSHVKLTRKGLYLANEVFEKFV